MNVCSLAHMVSQPKRDGAFVDFIMFSRCNLYPVLALIKHSENYALVNTIS